MNENQTLAIVVIAGGILLFVFKDAPTKIPEPAPEPMEQVYDQQIDQMNRNMQVLYNQINQQFIQKQTLLKLLLTGRGNTPILPN